MNLKKFKNCIMEENIVHNKRTNELNENQEKLMVVLDYIATIEKHIELENPLWLKKFIKENKKAMLNDNIAELLEVLK